MSPAAALLRRLESGEKIIWWRKAPPVINVPKDIVAQLAGLVEAVGLVVNTRVGNDREGFARCHPDALTKAHAALAALEAAAAKEGAK